MITPFSENGINPAHSNPVKLPFINLFFDNQVRPSSSDVIKIFWNSKSQGGCKTIGLRGDLLKINNQIPLFVTLK
jgi:hypothetical protein